MAVLVSLTLFFQASHNAEGSPIGDIQITAGNQAHQTPCDDADRAKLDHDCCIASAACAPFVSTIAPSLQVPERVQERPQPIADAVFDDLTALQFRPPRFSVRA